MKKQTKFPRPAVGSFDSGIGYYLVIVGVLLFVLAVTVGCANKAPTVTATPSPTISETAEAPPSTEEFITPFGSTYTWSDGITMSVSAPEPFEPTQAAAGVVEGHTNLVFVVTMTNGTADPIEIFSTSSAQSGGSSASAIFDLAHPSGEVGSAPMTMLLPGDSLRWYEAYSVADPADIVFLASPTLAYDNAIFSNRAY